MTLSLRALNRATLARQLLLKRSPMRALDAIEHLVGMQAQAPFAPYYGLWSRLNSFTGDELSGLLTSRKAVRIVLMRGTIHLVTAKDCHRLRPLVQPALDRMLKANATHGRPLARASLTTRPQVSPWPLGSTRQSAATYAREISVWFMNPAKDAGGRDGC